jgi:hypothetical protein
MVDENSFHEPARALIHTLAVLMALVLTGCSLSLYDGPAEVISLRSEQFGESFTLRLVGTSKSGPVYVAERLSDTERTQHPVFVTALRSCTVTEKDALLTVVRRLFVGLERIRVIEREQRTMNSDAKAEETRSPPAAPPPATKANDQAGVSLVGIEATFDGHDIRICALSSIVGRCSVDVALWSIPESRPYPHTTVAGVCHAVRDYALSTESTFSSNSFFKELASQ